MSAKIKLCLLSLALVGASAFAQEDAMTVVRDAETGKLRTPTAAEAAQLQNANKSQRMRQAAAQPVMAKMHKSGAQGARLTPEFLSSSVAVRTEDGKLAKLCFDRHEAAESVVQGHTHIDNPQSVTE